MPAVGYLDLAARGVPHAPVSVRAYTIRRAALALAQPVALLTLGPAVIRIDPAEVQLARGGRAGVEIRLDGVEGLYGLEFQLHFDPGTVRVVDADESRAGVQAAPGEFPVPDFVVLNEADNQAGVLRYAVTQVNPRGPVSGSGVVLRLTLESLDEGESSLELREVKLASRDAALIAVQAQSSRLRVASGVPPQPSTRDTETPPTTVAGPTPGSAPVGGRAGPTVPGLPSRTPAAGAGSSLQGPAAESATSALPTTSLEGGLVTRAYSTPDIGEPVEPTLGGATKEPAEAAPRRVPLAIGGLVMGLTLLLAALLIKHKTASM